MPPDLLKIISAAVTPVVMISAVALLNLGISNRSSALAHLIRSLTVECRTEETAEERKASLRAQIPLLMKRYTLSAQSQRALYIAMLCFVGTVLAITLLPKNRAWTDAMLALFCLGILLSLVAVVLESAEMQSAHKTLEIEMSDVVPGPDGRGE